MHTGVSGKKSKSTQIVLFSSFLFLLSFLLSACGSDAGILGGGGIWQASTLQKRPVHALAVDSREFTKIYTGDAEGKVFVSTDSGERWLESSSGLPASNNAINELLSELKLYAATDQGLFVSTDGAQQWSAVSGLPADRATALLYSRITGKAIYVGTAAHGVFVSEDGGTTWTAKSTGLPEGSAINDLASDPVGRHVWAATAAGLYRSDDFGATWRAFNDGLPANIGVHTVLPASASGGTSGLIYAGTNQGIFLSQDSGAHWARGKEPLSNADIRCLLGDYRRGSNTDVVYACTNVGPLLSNDGGQSWRAVAGGWPKSAPAYALVLGGQDSAQLLAASENVYLYPGKSGGVDLTRILFFVLIAALFYFLYQRSVRGRKRKKPAQPENEKTQPSEATGEKPPSEPETKKPDISE